MKKLIAFIVVLIALSGLAGCHKESNAEKAKRKAGELMDSVKDAIKD